MNRYARLRSSPIRKRARRRRGVIVDRAYLAWLHMQPCIIHGFNCPRFCGTVFAVWNELQVHHIDHNHRDAHRTVPVCKAIHLYGQMPSREILESHVAQLRALYAAKTGREAA